MKADSGPEQMLIIDDDTAHVLGLTARAAQRGLCARAVTHVPDETSELWRSADVVLLEPNLPGAPWFAVLRQVERQLAVCRRPRIIAIATSYPSTAMRTEAHQIGIDHVFVKPCSPENVLRTLVDAQPPPLTPWGSEALAWVEWEHINTVLSRCEGNMSTAARRLQIPRQTLYRKLRKQPPLPRLT